MQQTIFLDRQPRTAGGPFVTPARRDAMATAEALLVLADGSVWHGSTVPTTAAVEGEIRIVGDVVLVGAAGRLDVRAPASLRAHLAGLRPNALSSRIRGCLTASGATTPIHAKVALAVARGEIGRP